MSQPRGSLKHVLDLLDSGRFVATMTDLLGGHGVVVCDKDAWRPLGHDAPQEWTLRKFCKAHCADLFDFSCFDAWWATKGGKDPQWDVLSTCTIDDEPGLLLVEAKANDRELDWKGKGQPDKTRPQSVANHKVIGRSIQEANDALNKHLKGFAISRDTHYQLSNRIASVWKLADCGLPVALLYLGFTGDEGMRIKGSRKPIVDHDHWQRLMGAYLHAVAPIHFPGAVIPEPSSGEMRLLIESLPIIEISPPAKED